MQKVHVEIFWTVNFIIFNNLLIIYQSILVIFLYDFKQMKDEKIFLQFWVFLQLLLKKSVLVLSVSSVLFLIDILGYLYE